MEDWVCVKDFVGNKEGVMRLFFDLVVGYYYVTYRKTHRVLFSMFNGVRLAILCLRDRKTWFLDV